MYRKENIYYKYSNDSFLKYSAFYSDVIQKINIDQESSRSSLLKFLKIDPPQRIHLTKKIAPFIFLENSNQQNIQSGLSTIKTDYETAIDGLQDEVNAVVSIRSDTLDQKQNEHARAFPFPQILFSFEKMHSYHL